VVWRLVESQCDQDPGGRSCADCDQAGCSLDPFERSVATFGVMAMKVPSTRHASLPPFPPLRVLRYGVPSFLLAMVGVRPCLIHEET
jgi:hypothetical protein